MTTSTSSLRALPPKQALVLLLAEKARRKREREQREQAANALAESNRGLDADYATRVPTPADVPSVVLDKSHVLSDLYYKQAPYKVYYGGRGAAKTWAFAEALVRRAAATPILIVGVREYQASIRDSAHRVIKQTIERLGLSSWFDVGEHSIKSRVGAEFIFKGLHRNEHGLRSLEGADVCWVLEAQTVSEASWRSLIPTIRKEGAEVWVEFNVVDELDATYQRFVAHPPTGAIVHKVNYYDNPFFGGKLKQDMEDDKARDFHLYEHVWLGMPLKVSDAIIFNGKYAVREFDIEDVVARSARPFLGVDWGFANDPCAVMRSHVVERDRDGKRRLYVTHGAYENKVELRDLPAFFRTVPGMESWPIKADSSRPETISDLKAQGFGISAAEKWEGCVEDGIAHLRGFDEIVIHPTVPGLPLEARLYRYKTDPKQVDERGQPMVLPVVIDKHNHAWDAIRYSLDGYITRGGALATWARLGRRQ